MASVRVFFILLIMFLVNDCFFLFSSGVLSERPKDIALVFVLLMLLYFVLLERVDVSGLNNFAFWYIFLYLSLVITQASVASFKYQQSILDGLIVAREQFLYLFFLVVFWHVKKQEDFYLLMNAVAGLAIVAVFLSFYNYFGSTIFDHKWAEGHGYRSGVVRAFVPAMEMVVLATVWMASVIISKVSSFVLIYPAFFLLFSAVLFRQTKMHIVAASLSIFVMLVKEKRIKMLMYGFSFFVLIGLLSSLFAKENLLTGLMNEVVYALQQGDSAKTTWSTRLEQIENSSDILMDNIYTGSGGLVLREGEAGLSAELHDVRRGMDLGYFNWVKFFGLPGIILLGALVGFLLFAIFRKGVFGQNKAVELFALGQTAAILVSMVTIDYLRTPRGILVLCLLLVAITRIGQLNKFGEGK